jgi:hypothetical protein
MNLICMIVSTYSGGREWQEEKYRECERNIRSGAPLGAMRAAYIWYRRYQDFFSIYSLKRMNFVAHFALPLVEASFLPSSKNNQLRLLISNFET